MDVQIRFFDAGTLSDPARFADAYARVSAPRRAKIDRLRPGASRRLSLAAGLLLADTLAENGVSGLSAEEAEDENGKPCLPRCPELYFSLSHSGTWAMCAAADKPVGCDLQLTAPRALPSGSSPRRSGIASSHRKRTKPGRPCFTASGR